MSADVAKQPPNLELLDGGRRKTAETIQHERGGKLAIDTLERNPLRMLLNYLADPDRRRLATAGAQRRRRRDVGTRAGAGRWHGRRSRARR